MSITINEMKLTTVERISIDANGKHPWKTEVLLENVEMSDEEQESLLDLLDADVIRSWAIANTDLVTEDSVEI